jgi:glycosyltransferase involved in cell wall biosynthesis
VLFVETGITGGGSFESLYQLISNLDKRKFNPIVIYLNSTPYIEKMEKMGIEVLLKKDILYSGFLPSLVIKIIVHSNWIFGKYWPRIVLLYERVFHSGTIFFIKKMIRSKKIGLVVLNNDIMRHFFCVVGLNNIDIPVISYLRSFGTKGITPFIAKYANRKISRYIAYSSGVKEWWGKEDLDTSKIEVIYNGIKIESIKSLDLRSRYNIDVGRAPIIGCVGAIRNDRGYSFMIRSFKLLLKEEPNAFLVIVGNKHYEQLANDLEKLTINLGIEKSVLMPGSDHEAKRVISGLDIFCLPYRIEPFGRVLLEAWLAATPVIATRIGKIEEIITDGKDGLLVNYGDEEAMSRALTRVWRNKAIREMLIHEGRHTVEERFSIEECTRKIEDVFEKVINDYKSEKYY